MLGFMARIIGKRIFSDNTKDKTAKFLSKQHLCGDHMYEIRDWLQCTKGTYLLLAAES